ncbi:hypothetical protein SEPCBS57363_005287 [Sporothrix epigloea]|uniref:DUF7728 domain-containing protein n=1 Tax=Sporothrix epigloea TaxID=1892477 RepID=A0ABP0DWN5_9PEZI
MLSKALLAATLVTSTASAFLLPPPSDAAAQRMRHHHHMGAGSSVEQVHDDSMMSSLYHDYSKVGVPCPGCSIQFRKHGKHHMSDVNDKDESKDIKLITLTDVPNHINLDFSIDHAANGDRLLVNGFEIYPTVDINKGALMAVQVPDHFHKSKKHHMHDEDKKEEDDEELKKRNCHDRMQKEHSHDDKAKDGEGKMKSKHHGKHGKHLVEVPLGYAMQMQSTGHDDSNGMDVLVMNMQIIEVNNLFVQNIPAVNIRVIRTPGPNSALMIARIDVDGKDADEQPEGHQETNDEERLAAIHKELDACSNILCRWKVLLSSRIKAHHNGCMGKAMAKLMGGKGAAKDEQQHHHHHHHHHDEEEEMIDSEEGVVSDPAYRTRHHSFIRLVEKFVSHVLLPVFVGATVGAGSFFIGYAIATALVSLWRLAFRRNAVKLDSTQSQKVASVPVESRYANEKAVDEEKSGLMAAASQELPPYEDRDTEGSN